MEIKIMKVRRGLFGNVYTITFQYKTDFNELIIKTQNFVIDDIIENDTITETDIEVMVDEIKNHIPTYHCK